MYMSNIGTICDSCGSTVNTNKYTDAEGLCWHLGLFDYCPECWNNIVCSVCEEVQDDSFEVDDSIHICQSCREDYLNV